MAALTPGTVVLGALPVRVVTNYAPNARNFNYGSFSIVIPNGYLYTSPTEGQLWPRGDYAPMG